MPRRALLVLEATAGGTRRHLRELVPHLRDAGLAVEVACAVERDPLFEEDLQLFRRLGCALHVLPMCRGISPWKDLMAARALRRLIFAGSYDVVHLHSAKAGLIGRIAMLGLDVPTIYSPHGLPLLIEGPIGPFARMAEQVLAFRTSLLHAVSRAEGHLATELRLADARRVTVVENAVSIHEIERAVGPLARGGGTGGEVVYGFLGELRVQKDPLTFVRAARLIAARLPRAHFVLPDQGPLLSRVRLAVRKYALENRVTFVDSRRSLAAVLRACDVGVMPSRWEGLPYALLDAMALRIPVVASALPVFADVIGPVDRALLVPPENARALSEALVCWGTAGARKRRVVGERERDIVESEHAKDDWRERMCALYESAVAPSLEAGMLALGDSALP